MRLAELTLRLWWIEDGYEQRVVANSNGIYTVRLSKPPLGKTWQLGFVGTYAPLDFQEEETKGLDFAVTVETLQDGEVMRLQKAYKDGEREARATRKNGRLDWRLARAPAPHDELFRRILKEKYDIVLLSGLEGEISPEMRQSANGYNDVMARAILDRFDEDVIALAEEEAKRQLAEAQER